ncbi:MAG TPA: 50S ribosomal protein L25/general stress protein Ctc [Prolixibacteraceae bacterium]|nr:50S ribosomal protein L25/general stress protein Ctc [Prolixibacteraceae bacterium]
MKTFELSGKKRETVGKKESKKLRVEEKVPCVLYGDDDKNIHFACLQADLRKLIYTPNVYIVNLDIDGEKLQAIMHDIQFHPVSDEPLHIDFLKVSDNKLMKVEIPVKTKGYAKGIRSGGRLQVEKRSLTVLAFPKDLPDTITIDVTELDINDSYRVSDIETDTLKILNPSTVPVVRVIITRASRAAAATSATEEEKE